MQPNNLLIATYFITVTALADSVRLGAFDREPFNISCQYEIYYQYEHLRQPMKANAVFVSKGFIVFKDYNVLTARYESKESDSGEAIPKETNKLEAKSFLLHYQKKYKPYPYSVISENQFNETVYTPSNNDTHNQINIIKILRSCPEEQIEIEESQESINSDSTAQESINIDPAAQELIDINSTAQESVNIDSTAQESINNDSAAPALPEAKPHQ